MTGTTERLAVLFVRAAGTRYAIESGYVGRVVEQFDVHTIPRTPSSVTGATVVGGEVVAVIDLPAVLEPERQPGDARGPLVCLHRNGDAVGFRVDAVENLASTEITHLESSGRPRQPDEEAADPAIESRSEWLRGRIVSGATSTDAPVGVLDIPYLLETIANELQPRKT